MYGVKSEVSNIFNDQQRVTCLFGRLNLKEFFFLLTNLKECTQSNSQMAGSQLTPCGHPARWFVHICQPPFNTFTEYEEEKAENVLKLNLTQLCEGNEGLLPSSSSSLLPGQWSTGNNVRLNVNVCVNGIF